MAQSQSKRTVITAALPYANGPIHLGHLLEYIQADIFSRFLKLKGENAIYCCAEDTHGTPIDIAAQKAGVQPEDIINKYAKEHKEDFNAFFIDFDSYYSTNSLENKQYSDYIFNTVKSKGLIYEKDVELAYCAKCKRFLPDRYVKGKCPKCGADDQYGDVCEKCNAAYSTTELTDPFCTICGSAPTKRTSKHYFFKVSACSEQLRQWLATNHNLQPEVKNYVMNWVSEGLKDWDITRDGPYFGFRIPGEEDKYYYVWMDAPIGYIASTANYCKTHCKELDTQACVDEYWKAGKGGKIIHFIGKDIAYFHFLFWPAMLMNSGFNTPDMINVHGFVTVNGEKMSKSRGTFLTAKDYLKALPPELLRYYFAANLGKALSDINFDFDDFTGKANNELVANIANFAYRVLSFANRNCGSRLSDFHRDDKRVLELYEQIHKRTAEAEQHYEQRNFREAVHAILDISSLGNKYFQENAPWEMMKRGEAGKEEAQRVVTVCASIVRTISIIISPILPMFAATLQRQLNIPPQKWKDANSALTNHTINEASIMIQKVGDEINILKVKDVFAKLDLRVAKVIVAEPHPDAEKLLVLQIDLGIEKRQLVAGLKLHYAPEDLIGRNIIVVANLKPAQLRGKMSAGMLLAGDDGAVVRVLEAPTAKAGEQVFVNGVNSSPETQITIDDVLAAGLAVHDGVPMYKSEALRTKDGEISIADVKSGKIK